MADSETNAADALRQVVHAADPAEEHLARLPDGCDPEEGDRQADRFGRSGGLQVECRGDPESMSNVIHRGLRATPPVAAGGRGIHLFDSAGKRYIDASG